MHNPRLDALQRDDLIAELEALKAEGKIRMWGAALGPALKPDRQVEEGVYCVRERRAAVHIIYNLLEQVLGEAIFPAARETGAPVLVRVPHASGLLEGQYTTETEFAPNDHRSHRVSTDEMRQKWLLDGLKKIEKLDFASKNAGRTLGQMAIQFVLSEPSVASLFPNIYDTKQLAEFASATDTPPFSAEELRRVAELYRHNFYLEAEPIAA
jgi:aryl-alcohol dehydrogenase-like predicted oxidoreductase